MNKYHHGFSPEHRRCYARILEITDGHRIRRYTANDLIEHLGISRQHAYRLIAEPKKLKKQQYELLLYKDLRGLPSWGPGWYVEHDGLRAPNGYLITAHDMEDQSMSRQYISTLQRKAETQAEEIETLKRRVEWLQSRLSRPKNLQDETPSLRHPQLRVVKWPQKKPRITGLSSHLMPIMLFIGIICCFYRDPTGQTPKQPT